ncbi:hypothetical protein ACWD2L_05990 [Streptomyces sp. NPDC002754]
MIDEIKENVSLLTTVQIEQVEYVKLVPYHRGHCNKTEPCNCPVVRERRSKTLRNPGLLQQLKDYPSWGDRGAEPKAERPSPNKPVSRPNTNAGFLALDEITVETYMFYDRIAREAGRDPTLGLQAVEHVLTTLPYQFMQIQDDYPRLVEEGLAATRRWITIAQRTLGQLTSEGTFKDTSCGNCGGTLAIGRDTQRTDVRCVDCGLRYRMDDWMGLYEQGQAS